MKQYFKFIFKEQCDSPSGSLSGLQPPNAMLFNDKKKSELVVGESDGATNPKSSFDMFADEVELEVHHAPGTMAIGAMASENHALTDNWDDAEGYYREYF